MGDHHHNHDLKGRSLVLTILLNISITIAQLIGAFVSSSLSLLSDALHNFSDVMALVISYIANRLSKRKYTDKQSYGYKRAEILAAFFNAITLLFVSGFLIYEAVERFYSPNEVLVDGFVVALLAGFSIIANGISVLLVKKHSENNMNMRSAYLHLFSDMLSSIAVLLGGLLMHFYNVLWVDGVLSVAIALYLIVASWKLLLNTLRVLMQFTPKGIDVKQIAKKVAQVGGVENIHHIHIWQLNDEELHLEAHLSLSENYTVSEVDIILNAVQELLKTEFSIGHCTLQPSFGHTQDKCLIVSES